MVFAENKIIEINIFKLKLYMTIQRNRKIVEITLFLDRTRQIRPPSPKKSWK